MNEAYKNLLERRAIRSFEEKHITDEVMDLIVEAGKFAPTAVGSQGTLFAVIRNDEMVSKLSAMNAAVNSSDKDPFYGAPDVVIVFADSDNACWLQDGSLAMGNLMNAAHALGVGSCWINRAKEMFDSAEGRALADSWGIPASYRGVGCCILGYTKGEAPAPKPRKEFFTVTVK